jgi:tetratricopeptide (TPR) repeat protein
MIHAVRTRASVCAFVAFLGIARAADPEARAHFEQALALFGEGKVNEAIHEFEEAYRLSPRFEVLYNLGQAYGAAARPVEAAKTLELYLKQGGTQIDAARRAQVEATLRVYRGLTGALVVRAAPAGAALSVDGRPIESNSKLYLVTGRHALVATLDGYRTASRAIEVSAGATTEVSLELEANEHQSLGWLELRCAVPDVTVRIDGVVRGKTPLMGPLPLTSGTHRIALARPDYASHEADIRIHEGGGTPCYCNVRPLSHLGPERSARLVATINEADARLSVDGVPYHGDPIPFGRHTVSVSKLGFETWRGEWLADASARAPLRISLQPTEDYRLSYSRLARERRTWAYLAGGTGVAMAGLATGLFVWNAHSMSAWRTDRDSLYRDLVSGGPSSAELERAADIQQRAANLQRVDDAATAIAVAGGALIAVSLTLWLTGAEPYPREKGAAASSLFSPSGLRF